MSPTPTPDGVEGIERPVHWSSKDHIPQSLGDAIRGSYVTLEASEVDAIPDYPGH